MPEARRRIAIAGASGFLGRTLGAALERRDYAIIPVSRRAGPGVVTWDPSRRTIDGAAIDGVAAIVNLAGANIGRGRWTVSRKQLLVDSRLESTALLVRTIAAMRSRPAVLVSVSGTNFYGDTGEALVDEGAPPGDDFLAGLCLRWEATAAEAEASGVRVVRPRIGVVLHPREGALGRMLPFFRLGLGGPIGSGRQWMPWIAIDDVIGALVHVLEHDVSGPVNVVGPEPVRNRDFTAALAAVLHRPAVLPAPALPLRLAFGEVVDALLLGSQRVSPRVLVASGYRFRYPELEPALRHVLGAA